MQHSFSEHLDLIAGMEYRHENFTDEVARKDLAMQLNKTLFFEGFKNMWGNLTLGTRYDEHNQFGHNLAPRLGFTHIFEDSHIKAL